MAHTFHTECGPFRVRGIDMSTVTVVDHVQHSAAVSPEQAVAFVRALIPTWTERRALENGSDRILWTLFDEPGGTLRQIMIPGQSTYRDYSRRMSEAIDAIVALRHGVDKPSDVLFAMAAMP